ncbi:kinase-like domain-containing protein [Mycena alexandri]|uniref:Kinase-like domain-containing protein n=1 Tax=Mycena alexandri TaxID=1745969 RepID=A0AAD6SLR3_9AGAR|nr:kinase-like domain-containing protein [Mycena alexandri]
MTIMHDLSAAAGVQAYLETSQFASSTVTPLTGGTGNFAFRLHLLRPYNGKSTAVVKHARPYVATAASIPLAIERQAFEAKALEKVKEGLNCGPKATVPSVYHLDEEAHILIMEDCGENSINLKSLLVSAPPSVTIAQDIGRALGQFLGRLHSWGTNEPAMLDFFDQNEQAKEITAWVTYGRILPTLTSGNVPAVAFLPEPVPESDLDDIRAIIAERTAEINTSRAALTMGDFWTGNVMVNLTKDAITGETSFENLYVIDWELAKTGVAALDVGQFCAEALTVTLFKPDAVEASKALIEAFLTEYRAHCGVMAPHMANTAAKHMGAHLVAITSGARWGTPEETAKAIEVGLEHLMEGCSDRWVRERSVLSPLM